MQLKEGRRKMVNEAPSARLETQFVQHKRHPVPRLLIYGGKLKQSYG
jgi:hypothetical protein